jgi:DeoR family transcriptional regulator, glycerol-3-phosphate regulon repressor
MARQKQRLTQHERHAQILALLRHEGTVRIATLAKTFGVTTETARRDLDELAASGALKRTYGGGASRSLTDEPGIGVRSKTHAAGRAAIARSAAGMVESGDALMIDGGSTTRLFAQVLAARELHLTVVTNCLPVARALGTNPHCRTILCPGNYVAREDGVYGSDAVDYLRRFKANKAFIGAGGVTPEGITDADSLSCSIKRAMMERSGRSILLVDRSKYGEVHFERVCALADIDVLVSEAAPPKRLAASLKSAGVEVAIAAD